MKFRGILFKIVSIKKFENSTCQDCNLLCYEYSIQCDQCEKLFHSKYQKCSSYQKSGKAKKYFCTFCKENGVVLLVKRLN